MKSRIFLALLAISFLSACNGTIEVGIEHGPTQFVATTDPVIVLPDPTATDIPESSKSSLPAATMLAAPTLTAPTETQVLPVSTPGQKFVQIFLIGLEDNGVTGTMVGCGDSVIPVQAEITPTQGVLKAALEALLAIKDQYYGQSG